MADLGYNYRLTDFQCALGLTQLQKLPAWVLKRQKIAREYSKALAEIPAIMPLKALKDRKHSYHLYVIRLGREGLDSDRSVIFQSLRRNGIGVNVHYIPVHLQPFYREKFKTGLGLCSASERVYEQILSLPIFPGMSKENISEVVRGLKEAIGC